MNQDDIKVWLEIAKNVKGVLTGLDTSTTRPLEEVLKDMNDRLSKTGYKINSDYTPKTYEYFDFDLFRQDNYGIRIFLGHGNINNLYIHGLDSMYLYAPNDEDDYLSDITIKELENKLNLV